MLYSAGRCRRSPLFFPRLPLFISLVLLCPSPLLQAQSTAGRVLGRVLDPTGALVPGAKLTLSSTDSGVTQKAESAKNGDYIFLTVPGGTYRLQAEAPGFQSFIADGIAVQLNATVTYDIRLTVG